MNLSDFLSLYPSISAIITGVLAVLVTIQPPSMRNKNKWIALFVFIAVTAVVAMFWGQIIIHNNQLAQGIKDSKRDEDFSHMKEQLSAIIKMEGASPQVIAETKREVETMEMDLKTLASKSINENTPLLKLPLKKRALILATQILKFIGERDSIEESDIFSKFNTHEDFQEQTKKYMDFSSSTMNTYYTKFSARVIAIHDELVESGYDDKSIEMYYQNPVNPIGIRKLGEHIGAMAERIP